MIVSVLFLITFMYAIHSMFGIYAPVMSVKNITCHLPALKPIANNVQWAEILPGPPSCEN